MRMASREQRAGRLWMSLEAFLYLTSFSTPGKTDTPWQPPIGPDSHLPSLLGAQYTFIDQNQSQLRSPYSGPRSLDPSGDTEATNTIGIYTGWAPFSFSQLYLDVEKFDGDGDSGATGLAGLT